MSAAEAGALVPAARSGWRSRVAAYVGLTKPRIIELLLVTTVPAMVLADKGLPSPWLVLTVLFGRDAGRRRRQHDQLRLRP